MLYTVELVYIRRDCDDTVVRDVLIVDSVNAGDELGRGGSKQFDID